MIDALRELAARVVSFLRRREREADFEAELESHLEMSVADHVARGLDPAQARRQARIDLGGVEQARELHRESRALPWLDVLGQDLRYTRRLMRRDVGLTVFAVLIVGLGVGAGSTVFSVFNAMLLRDLPFEEPERLVWMANGSSSNLSAQTVQVGNLLDFLELTETFSGVAGFSPFYGRGDLRLTGADEPLRLTGVPVTAGFFPLLGVAPQLGRFFSPEESRFGAPRTAVLAHDFWLRYFEGDPGVVGSAVTLNGEAVTVIGVLPASFDFEAIFTPGSRADLFVPFALSPETHRMGNTLALVGRLREAANLEAAQSEASAIAARVEADPMYPDAGRNRNGFAPLLSPLRERVSGQYRSSLVALVGAVGLLMLLVCANLSNLLLARATTRQDEMAVRAALGASRARLIRQMLIESLALSLGGAALGLVLAVGGTALLRSIEGTEVPLLAAARVDGTVLAFTVALTVVTGIVFGLAPALRVSRPGHELRVSQRGNLGGGDWQRNALVVAEVALACVLLFGTGLLLRSLVRVLEVDLGFESENVLALRVDPHRGALERERLAPYFGELKRAAAAVPGVEATGLTDALPLGENFGWRLWTISPDGSAVDEEEQPHALVRIVDDGYLQAMQIPILAGRGFLPTDLPSSEPVTLVNETLARQLWPGQDPLGRVLHSSGVDRRVVGVVGGVRYFGLERESGAEMYLALGQTTDFGTLDLVVRGSMDAETMVPALRSALRSTDPELPVADFVTVERLVDRSLFPRRAIVLMATGFALFGLIVATLGVYGVISYTTAQRRQELGLRMALGATARALGASVMRRTLLLVAVGTVVGLAASWLVGRSLQGLLYGTSPSDSLTVLVVALVLVVFSLLAGYLPARRASRLSPVEALRAD